MPTSGKKNTAKASHKNNSSVNKSRVSTHPSWMDMIKECIIAHPDEARSGVSRPTIKKFVESTYHVAVDHAAASQLNRAITSGSEKGTFVLPKGPSGKVKLAPKARTDAAKENAKPVSKKSAPTKAVGTKAPATKAKTATSKPMALKKATIVKAPVKVKASAPTAKTKRIGTKSSPVKHVKKPITARAATTKKPAATKRMTTAKKGAVKKSVIGEAKKPLKRAPAAKAKPATKPAAKAKPISKTKPASKSSPKKPASQKA